MLNALSTPWDGRAVPPAPARPVSFEGVAAPVGAPRGGRTTSLVCPWSSTGVPVPQRHPVTSLPTLAPTVPVPRAAAEVAVPAEV